MDKRNFSPFSRRRCGGDHRADVPSAAQRLNRHKPLLGLVKSPPIDQMLVNIIINFDFPRTARLAANTRTLWPLALVDHNQDE
jgi:hypothetical protein